MELRLFGPLEVYDADGVRLDPGTRKQRAVLAMLALRPGRAVSLDRLIEELWAGEAPAKVTATLQAYISHLRRVLEPDRKPRTLPRCSSPASPATCSTSRPPRRTWAASPPGPPTAAA